MYGQTKTTIALYTSIWKAKDGASILNLQLNWGIIKEFLEEGKM